MNKTQELKTFINQWTISYKELDGLLDGEQKALEARDFTSLEKIVNAKNKLVIQINEQQIPVIEEQGFNGLLANNNITPIKESALSKLHKARDFCLQTDELKNHWLNLIELVEQCNYKNEVNANMVQLITTSTKRTFNLIKGFDPDNNLYNRDGDRSMVQLQSQPLIA